MATNQEILDAADVVTQAERDLKAAHNALRRAQEDKTNAEAAIKFATAQVATLQTDLKNAQIALCNLCKPGA